MQISTPFTPLPIPVAAPLTTHTHRVALKGFSCYTIQKDLTSSSPSSCTQNGFLKIESHWSINTSQLIILSTLCCSRRYLPTDWDFIIMWLLGIVHSNTVRGLNTEHYDLALLGKLHCVRLWVIQQLKHTVHNSVTLIKVYKYVKKKKKKKERKDVILISWYRIKWSNIFRLSRLFYNSFVDILTQITGTTTELRNWTTF